MSIRSLNSEKILAELPAADGYLLAYSGGADSSALLHLFSAVKNLSAIHINHGLHAQASDWQQHCRNICQELDVPLIVEQAHLPDSSENSCRLARYAFFAKHLKKNHLLLLAHHAADQAETILLKLLRGTGSKGFAGMQKYRLFAQAALFRPLLQEKPEVLKLYLKSNGFAWIEDPSNQQNNYKRNIIRNQVMPLLKENFNHAEENILRTADNIAHSHQLLDYFVNKDGAHLCLSDLDKIPEELRLSYFYQWLSSKNRPLPDKKTLARLLLDFTLAKQDKHPSYRNKYYQLQRWKESIYCLENYTKIDSDQCFSWHTEKPFEFPNQCGAIHYSSSEKKVFQVRFNQVAQRIKLAGKNHHKKVKNLFQEQCVSPWDKDNTPFIYDQGQLVSLAWPWSHAENSNGNFKLQMKALII